MPDFSKTPLELALDREVTGEIDYCDECDYMRSVGTSVFCGISGKLLHPMMFLRGQGTGPARRCIKRKEAINMGLTGADLARMGPSAQKQVLAKLGMERAPRTTKYHNEKTQRVLEGGKVHTFDSQKEARRFDELMLMQKAGKIRYLVLQKQFTLQESYITAEGERVRAIRYVADFVYERPTEPDCNNQIYWLPVVEDTKGVRTSDYKLKRKLMQEKFGITIKEV